MKRIRIHLLALGLLGGFATGAVLANDAYPNKPVKIVVPYPPGGPYDTIARVLGQKAGDSLGKPFVIENRGGASGMIGSDAVAKSAPDGYTLLMGGIGPNAINASLYPKVPYDAGKDFAPVIEVLRSANIVVVNPAVKANTLAELIALIRASNGKMSYASAGPGSSTHLFAEMFKQAQKLDLLQVPYRGDSPAVTATLGGETPIYFASAASIMPHIQSERLRALAVTGDRRLENLPNVPTIGEAAIPGFNAHAWYGIFAPAGTPADIVATLNRHFNAALADPEVRTRLAGAGSAQIVGGSPADFAKAVQTEIEKWQGVIRAGNITVD